MGFDAYYGTGPTFNRVLKLAATLPLRRTGGENAFKSRGNTHDLVQFSVTLLAKRNNQFWLAVIRMMQLYWSIPTKPTSQNDRFLFPYSVRSLPCPAANRTLRSAAIIA